MDVTNILGYGILGGFLLFLGLSIATLLISLYLKKKVKEVMQVICLLTEKVSETEKPKEAPKIDNSKKKKELEDLENSLNVKLQRVKELKARL